MTDGRPGVLTLYGVVRIPAATSAAAALAAAREAGCAG
jgi:hypothetical protein